MSNYTFTVKDRKTAELHKIDAIDNYFCSGEYGYKFYSGKHCGSALTKKQLDIHYEPEKL
jgi:hypothetical protein